MFLEVNHSNLFVEPRGEGQPMLMMHGGLGLDHTSYWPTFEPISTQAQLILYDHRGNGRSQRPDSFDGITHDTWIDDADALRAQLGHEKIILFGHSYGGFLAQDYAIKYGHHLTGLVLCSTAPVLDYMDIIQANAAARGTAEQLDALGQVFGRPMADDEEWRKMWNVILPFYFKAFDPELAAEMDQKTSYSGAAWNHCNAHCLPVFNALPNLAKIKVPTLIISGADDWITPPEQGGRRIHEAIPHSEFVVFENSGHWPFLEEHDRFTAVLTDWLRRLS